MACEHPGVLTLCIVRSFVTYSEGILTTCQQPNLLTVCEWSVPVWFKYITKLPVMGIAVSCSYSERTHLQLNLLSNHTICSHHKCFWYLLAPMIILKEFREMSWFIWSVVSVSVFKMGKCTDRNVGKVNKRSKCIYGRHLCLPEKGLTCEHDYKLLTGGKCFSRWPFNKVQSSRVCSCQRIKRCKRKRKYIGRGEGDHSKLGL